MKATPLNILLIEDSPTDAILVESLLNKVPDFPFQMERVNALEPGIKKLTQGRYDALILDLSLPDSFGIATYESVRESGPNLPIIIVSGSDDRELLAEALSKGADNYLIKDTLEGNRIAIAILSAIRNRTKSPAPLVDAKTDTTVD
jgi:DNA-binding NarL/FixJ family response regulator